MAHLVKDMNDLHIQWHYAEKKYATLQSLDPDTNEILEDVPISIKVAELLIEHGVDSGS